MGEQEYILIWRANGNGLNEHAANATPPNSNATKKKTTINSRLSAELVYYYVNIKTTQSEYAEYGDFGSFRLLALHS